MLALWAGAQGDASLRERACMAALDIGSAVKRFNDSSGTTPLPTRLGLHSGTILLGNIGAEDHFEYRPMGDIVNTASRIEGLNKYLGTGILASEEVSDQLQGFVFRELGEFLLAGKNNPVVIRELICRDGECREADQQLCSSFSLALSAYRARKWEEALELFTAASRIFGRDNPSAFYIDLCRTYKARPPEGPWRRGEKDGKTSLGYLESRGSVDCAGPSPRRHSRSRRALGGEGRLCSRACRSPKNRNHSLVCRQDRRPFPTGRHDPAA